MGAIKGIAVLIVIIVILTAAYYVVEDTSLLNGIIPTNATSYTIPAELSTQFSRNFTFSSSSGSNETFNFYVTPTITDSLQQTSITVSHSSNINETYKNSQGRTYLDMQVGTGGSYVNISYSIKSYGKSWQSMENSADLPSQIPSSLKTEYDHPEYFNASGTTLEVINPSFFAPLTQNLTKNATTVVGKLRAIYDYIVHNYSYNISYNIGNVPLSALQVYNAKYGDCEELSYLFESMSRSIGIPSWTQYGLLIQEVNGQAELGEHAWVQTYIPTGNDTGTYVNIDMTVEVGGKDLGRGFLVKYPYSLVEWNDTGNSSAMVAYHTDLVAPARGISISSGGESDTISSFNQTGSIALVQGNIFSLIAANASKGRA